MIAKTQRMGRLQEAATLEAVQEVFRQDFGDVSLQDIIRQSGKSTPARDWEMKAGANTSASKK